VTAATCGMVGGHMCRLAVLVGGSCGARHPGLLRRCGQANGPGHYPGVRMREYYDYDILRVLRPCGQPNGPGQMHIYACAGQYIYIIAGTGAVNARIHVATHAYVSCMHAHTHLRAGSRRGTMTGPSALSPHTSSAQRMWNSSSTMPWYVCCSSGVFVCARAHVPTIA
jgi:hypothetical protein